MKSRWFELKDTAVQMRQTGISIKTIEQELGIPRSTLSGWFKNIQLTESQQEILAENSAQGLKQAQEKASDWHRTQKANRLIEMELATKTFLDGIEMNDLVSLELALAFLYLGEGSKRNSHTSLGSSDPHIARFYIEAIERLYGVPRNKFRCWLHLRADQNAKELTEYWAHELNLPSTNFGKPSFDARTSDKPTYQEYKGVCLIDCGRVEIQRRLMYIAHGFCDRVSSDFRVSWGG